MTRDFMVMIATAFLLVAGLGVRAQPGAANLSLTASVGEPTGTPPLIQVQLTNNAPKTATAWAINIGLVYSDRPTQLIATDQDFYEVFAVPTGSRNGPLGPGQTTSLSVPISGPTVVPLSVSVRPVAVVYHDQTSEGDPQRIAAIFNRRNEDLLALRAITSELRNLNQRGSSANAVQALIDDLKTPPVPQASSGLRHLAANNLAIAIAASRGDVAVLARQTATTLALLERYEHAAQIHSQPK